MIFIKFFFSIIFISIFLVLILVNISILLLGIILNFKLIALTGKYFTFQALVFWLWSNRWILSVKLILNSFPAYGLAYIIFRKYIPIRETGIVNWSEPDDFILLSWNVLQILCGDLIKYISFLLTLRSLFFSVFFYILVLLLRGFFLFFYLLRFLLILSLIHI